MSVCDVAAPLIMSVIEKTAVIQRNPRLWLPTQAAVVSCCFLFGLPFSLAMFKQTGTLDCDRLEPHLQDIARADGIEEVLYSKGL